GRVRRRRRGGARPGGPRRRVPVERARLAVADLRAERRRDAAPRLPRDAPAGAAAAVDVPAAAPRHRLLRRADDLLDLPARAGRPRAARCRRDRRRLRGREPARRPGRGLPRDGRDAPGEAAVTAAVWVGVALLGGAGAWLR